MRFAPSFSSRALRLRYCRFDIQMHAGFVRHFLHFDMQMCRWGLAVEHTFRLPRPAVFLTVMPSASPRNWQHRLCHQFDNHDEAAKFALVHARSSLERSIAASACNAFRGRVVMSCFPVRPIRQEWFLSSPRPSPQDRGVRRTVLRNNSVDQIVFQ